MPIKNLSTNISFKDILHFKYINMKIFCIVATNLGIMCIFLTIRYFYRYYIIIYSRYSILYTLFFKSKVLGFF